MTVITLISGLHIVMHTKNDLIHAKCNLANVYAYVVAGYFLQDSLVLIYIEWQKSINTRGRLRLLNPKICLTLWIHTATDFRLHTVTKGCFSENETHILSFRAKTIEFLRFLHKRC